MKPFLMLCLLAFLAFPTHSQSRFSFGMKMDAGMAGVFEKEILEHPNFVETRTAYAPGFYASFGLVSEYYLDEHKHFGVSAGLLTNISAYTQQKRLKFRNFSPGPFVEEAERDKTFQLVNLQAPVKLVYRQKKFTFSLGIVNNWLGFAQMKRQSRARWLDPPGEWIKPRVPTPTISTFTLGEQGKHQSSFFALGTTLDHRYTPQILCGVAYKIGNNLSLGLEFTNQLRANYINHTDISLDVVSFERHEFKHNALYISLIWWTERK